MSGQLWQNLCQCFFPHHSKKCQRKLKFHHNKRECSLQSIIVGGYDNCFEIVEKPNNENEDGDPIIHPPVKLSFNPSSLLSYSAYSFHSILVTSDSSLMVRSVPHFRKHSSMISHIFRSKIKVAASLMPFQLFAVTGAPFICSQIAAMKGSSCSAIVK